MPHANRYAAGRPVRRLGLPAVLAVAGSTVLAACGSTAATSAASAPAGGAASSQPAAASSSPAPVAVVESSVTAQMVSAASGASSSSHEATFTLHAYTAAGRPAAGEPVSWWVGPMVPLSGVHPAHWFKAATAAAGPYVVSATTVTGASGQAQIVLLGQRAKVMEMVAVRIGDLDSFSQAAGRAVGQLDAWWTAPSSTPTAPAGDRVTISPFLAATQPGSSTMFSVRVTSGAGVPIAGAGVDWVPQSPVHPSMTGSGSAGASSSQVAIPPSMTYTNAAGATSYTFHRPGHGSTWALRFVVTKPGSKSRVSGAAAAELLGGS